MSRGDELRRLVRLLDRLGDWVSPSDLVPEVGATYRTVLRLLRGIDTEVGLERRQFGRRVEYRRRQRPPS